MAERPTSAQELLESLRPSKRRGRYSGRGVEVTDPEKAAAVIDAITEPPGTYENLTEAFKAAGLPKVVSDSVIRRIRVKYFGAVTEARALKTAELLKMLGEKLHLALGYVDDKVLAEASARDLMLGVGILTEKRQLLMGEPTQIISDHERKKLHELLPAFIEEARRRGVTVEGTVTAKTVTEI